ncbi:hypothetical protein TB2_001131 [Malus domestica]
MISATEADERDLKRGAEAAAKQKRKRGSKSSDTILAAKKSKTVEVEFQERVVTDDRYYRYMRWLSLFRFVSGDYDKCQDLVSLVIA